MELVIDQCRTPVWQEKGIRTKFALTRKSKTIEQISIEAE